MQDLDPIPFNPLAIAGVCIKCGGNSGKCDTCVDCVDKEHFIAKKTWGDEHAAWLGIGYCRNCYDYVGDDYEYCVRCSD